jgi:hypothetical protein
MPFERETSKKGRDLLESIRQALLTIPSQGYVELRGAFEQRTYYAFCQEDRTKLRYGNLREYYFEVRATHVEGPSPTVPANAYEGSAMFGLELEKLLGKWGVYIRELIGSDGGPPAEIISFHAYTG